MHDLPWILLLWASFGLVVYAIASSTVFLHTRKTRKRTSSLGTSVFPPITLLKPLRGLEEDLEHNLESFFEQDYPAPMQVVFASLDPADEALSAARRVAARHPHIETVFAFGDAEFGLNPKVANLEGALRRAKYDLVLQSDANVRVAPDYLRTIVNEFDREGASLLSSLLVGEGENSAGASMENAHLASMVAAQSCLALYGAGICCVVGKSMLFRRSELDEVGGLASVRDVLAEDFILGRAMVRAKKKVVLAKTPVFNVNRSTTVDRFMSRHARWLKMRAVINPPVFAIELFVNPVAYALLSMLVSGFALAETVLALSLIGLKTALDGATIARTRGQAMHWADLLWIPFKDLLLLAIWPYAALSRSIEWRGTRLRLGWQTKLRPDDGAFPVRMARRVMPKVRA